MSREKKAEAARELAQAWEEIGGLLDSLSEREMLMPGVVGEWSMKDLLGHMAFWTQKTADDLKLVADGREEEILVPSSDEAVAGWNKREADRRRDLTLAAVREEWLDSFQAAKEALRAVPAEALEVEVKGWTMLHRFAEDTYSHYREHLEHIAAWQRRLETTEA